MNPSRPLLLCASPRRGNCEAMVQTVASHWPEAGEPVLLRRHAVHPCVGCGACRGTGVCIYARQDQADNLLTALLEAQALVLVAPVYFYGPPAQLKALIDRSQAVWERNGCAFPEVRRPAHVILAGARTGGKRLFEASLLILRCFFDAMGFALQETLLLRGLDGPLDFQNCPDAHASLLSWIDRQVAGGTI